MQCYPLFHGDAVVGSVHISKEGLYSRIECQCDLPTDGMHRVAAFSDGYQIDLGICVPCGTRFGIQKRVPSKQLGEGEVIFRILPQKGSIDHYSILLEPDKPFAFLSKLGDAHLEVHRGDYRLAIPGKQI